MEFDSEWLETIVKRHERENSIAKIRSVETESAVAKGDNYASDITRVKMCTYLGSGRKKTRSIIIKSLPSTEVRAQQFKEFGVFQKEILMYSTILPSMARLMDEVDDKDEPMWIECIEYRRYDRIVLEDLKELGYEMADRRKGLDFDHSALAVKCLGKFHAMSVALKERGLLNPDDFKSPFTKELSKDDIGNSLYNRSLKNLRTAIETTWLPEEKIYSAKLEKLENQLWPLIRKIMTRDDTKFNVLLHGDCWTNNMMFRYSQNHGKSPISLRFVDFQMSNFNSYALDLTYLLITSLQNEVRINKLDELLKIYHDSLHKNLEKFNCTIENAPTMEAIKTEMKAAEYFGLSMVVITLTLMKMEPEDVPDMEDLMKAFVNKDEMMDIKPYLGKAYTKTAKSLLEQYVKSGLI